ncbi:MAG TPA: hypothetical protein VFW87_20320 [Pirellulales bacterium]|nr:hypothetical protein [Pirellulales bacterium]
MIGLLEKTGLGAVKHLQKPTLFELPAEQDSPFGRQNLRLLL